MNSQKNASSSRYRQPLIAALSLLMAAPAAAAIAPRDARADGVRVSIDGRVRVRVAVPGQRVRRVRVRRLPGLFIPGFFRAGIYIGPRFAAPPPPPPIADAGCDCAGPPGAEPAPTVVAAATPAPVRRFALGFAGSHVEVDERLTGSDSALLARVRLNRRWEIELEAGGVDYDDSQRTDARLGASAYFHFMPEARLAPYLVAGAGVSRADLGNDVFVDQGYGEIGAGLTFRLTDRFHLAADLRGGARGREDRDDDRLSLTAPTGAETIGDEEEFARFRLAGLVYF